MCALYVFLGLVYSIFECSECLSIHCYSPVIVSCRPRLSSILDSNEDLSAKIGKPQSHLSIDNLFILFLITPSTDKFQIVIFHTIFTIIILTFSACYRMRYLKLIHFTQTVTLLNSCGLGIFRLNLSLTFAVI